MIVCIHYNTPFSVTATKLESCLEENFRTYFKRRGEYDRIVIYDWFSTETMQSNKIQLLLSILIKVRINLRVFSLTFTL